MTAGAVPPNDLDAEASVISTALLERDAYALIADRVTPARFYSEANRRIWEAIGQLHEAGGVVDLVTVAGKLRDAGRLDQCGGAAYLAQLIDATPATAHVEAHAARVAELARLRELIAVCQTFAAEGYAHRGSVQSFIDAAAERIRAIADTPDVLSMVHVSEIVREKFAAWSLADAGRTAAGIRTGFHDLDRLIGGLRPAKVYLLAARPGVGKSALALNVATATASFGAGVAVFSMEMERDEISDRQLAAISGVPLKLITSSLPDPVWRERNPRDVGRVETAGRHLAAHPIWIDDRAAIGLSDIRAKCKRVDNEIKRNGGTGLALVIVDYLQLMQEPPGARSREQAVGAMSRGLKILAKELQCSVLVLSQMNREIEKRTGRHVRPKLSDLRESGSLEQDADVVLFLYREDADQQDGPTELIVAKQRGGPPGKVDLFYRGHITRFDSMTKEAA